MSIRTIEQLSDKLSEDLIWRKKELTGFKLLIESGSIPPDRRAALLRAGVALLYAHWEGFVKTASRSYLQFVHFQGLTYRQLSRNFIALGARSLLTRASQTSKVKTHIDVTNFFFSRLEERSIIPYKDGINTKSNLSSHIFREIIDTLGLDYSEFETKERLLDELLLSRRNNIAHGDYLLISVKVYQELNEQVIGLMELFRNQIDNAAALKHYCAVK